MYLANSRKSLTTAVKNCEKVQKQHSKSLSSHEAMKVEMEQLAEKVNKSREEVKKFREEKDSLEEEMKKDEVKVSSGLGFDDLCKFIEKCVSKK